MVVFKGNPIDLVPWSLAIFFIPFITFYQIFIAMKNTLNGQKNEEKIMFGISVQFDMISVWYVMVKAWSSRSLGIAWLLLKFKK